MHQHACPAASGALGNSFYDLQDEADILATVPYLEQACVHTLRVPPSTGAPAPLAAGWAPAAALVVHGRGAETAAGSRDGAVAGGGDVEVAGALGAVAAGGGVDEWGAEEVEQVAVAVKAGAPAEARVVRDRAGMAQAGED